MTLAADRIITVILRYRFRLYPTTEQAVRLAQTFGCARVVYNDALRVRDAAFAAGEKIADAEIQRRIITLAKKTPERAWLADAPSVALVQACNDARRAYHAWYASIAGRRKGPKVGKPKFKKKRSRQSVRFTRKTFQASQRTLYLCRIGDVRIRFSRPLPSEPSSVTVIQESDGRYYASFVVERSPAPLPASPNEVGVDLGIDRLAVTSSGEIFANRRLARKMERRIARAQRNMDRKRPGSANRAKARHRVAVLHRKVRQTRLDFAHKTALHIVRENQAVYVEDLPVSGLLRTRIGKSVRDAGWSILVRALEEKTAYYGRAFGRVDRWYPSSQICSACGVKDGPKPLSVRTWSCSACGAVHDRDVNAAKNILTAGRAERLNARGGDVRPPETVAVPVEAGTLRGAA